MGLRVQLRPEEEEEEGKEEAAEERATTCSSAPSAEAAAAHLPCAPMGREKGPPPPEEFPGAQVVFFGTTVGGVEGHRQSPESSCWAPSFLNWTLPLSPKRPQWNRLPTGPRSTHRQEVLQSQASCPLGPLLCSWGRDRAPCLCHTGDRWVLPFCYSASSHNTWSCLGRKTRMIAPHRKKTSPRSQSDRFSSPPTHTTPRPLPS